MLRLHLGRHLGMLALFNILPIIGGLWLWWQMRHGNLVFRSVAVGDHVPGIVAVLLVCGVLVGCASWVLWPVAIWVRAYPGWHFAHGSRALWALPMIAGWLLALTLQVMIGVVVIACGAVVLSAFYELLRLVL